MTIYKLTAHRPQKPSRAERRAEEARQAEHAERQLRRQERMQREQEQRDREDQEWDELVALTWEQTYKANDFATRINMAATAGTEDLGSVIAEARGWLTEPEVASNGYLDRGWLDMALWMHGGLNAIT